MSAIIKKPLETKNIPVEKCIGGIFDLRSTHENGELKKSIEEDGILQPISVRPSKVHPGKYDVIDGNRRVRIATTLGIKEVPAVIYLELEDNDALKMAIVTNVARATLTARDQGVAVKRYRDLYPDKTWDTIAVELGMSPQVLRDYVYLADMEPTIEIAKTGVSERMAERKGELTIDHARRLARVTARRHSDLKERHEAQKALVKATQYLPPNQRVKVLTSYGKASPETIIPTIIEEVKQTTKHIVHAELTDEMYGALEHFMKDRNLDISKALRQLLLEGLRHYQYMV